MLTHGSPLAPLAILSYLNPARGIFTGVTRNGDRRPHPIGQVHYIHGRRSARLAFLMPEEGAGQADMVLLLERLAFEAGGWGAHNVLAEIEERSPLVETLRRAGFVVYARQQIWRLTGLQCGTPALDLEWQPALPEDEIAIRSLCQSLTPPLVQSAEARPESQGNILVYHDPNEPLAIAEGWFGPRGIYVQPLFHPGVDHLPELLAGLVQRIAPQNIRPLYLAVRSYQAELETPLKNLEAEAGPRQVLMVKYLAGLQRVPAYNRRQVVLEGTRAEPTTPIVSHINPVANSNSTINKN